MTEILHDISWVVSLRHEFLTPIFEFFTWLGYPTFVMLLLPLGYWLWSKDVFTRVATIVLLSTVLNAFLKDLWENPRPDLVFRLDPEVGKSFGMPSGHAQVSAVLWFWMAYEIRRIWAWVTAGIVVTGICLSRIYLGIHDLEDILVGLVIALISMLAFRFVLTADIRWLKNLGLSFRLLAIFVVALITKLTWPPAAHSIEAFVAFGLLAAWLVGASIDGRHVNFIARREPWALVLTAVLGVVGLIGLLTLSALLLNGLDSMTAGTIRSIILGVYMTLLAPMVFKLCRLSVTRVS